MQGQNAPATHSINQFEISCSQEAEACMRGA